MISLWVRSFVSDDGINIQSLMTALNGVMNLQNSLKEIPCGSGIFIFDKVTPQIINFIRNASNNGMERILGISIYSKENDSPWELLNAGASDIFNWKNSDYSVLARNIAARFERWNTIDNILQSNYVRETLIGESNIWKLILRQIIEVAHFTDYPVLIMGESGTGKELIARLIHKLDSRSYKKELVLLDCSTIIPALSGSEFFGHEKGAFTGAVNERDGAFALADQGTLFLDEVGELPLNLQAELLRVVQEKQYKRVGSNIWHNTNFRLICATNRELLNEETKGNFRKDFYYRIACWTCRLPSLSERKEDIMPLANYFFELFSPSNVKIKIDDSVRRYLMNRQYPGNIRELRQVVSRIMVRNAKTGTVTAGDIPPGERPVNENIITEWYSGILEQNINQAIHIGLGMKEISKQVEDLAIRIAMRQTSNSTVKAAQILGVSERTIQLRKNGWNNEENGCWEIKNAEFV